VMGNTEGWADPAYSHNQQNAKGSRT